LGIKDLKYLLKKKRILFTFLIIWLIIGLIFFHFNIEFSILGIIINGSFFFIPLLIVCLTLFLLSFLLRTDLQEFKKDDVIRVIIFIVGISIVFYIIGLAFITELALTLFIISIFSYVLITAIFTVDTCYDIGVKIDNTFHKAPKAPRVLLRWLLFLGGIALSIFIIYFFVDAGYQMTLKSQISVSVIDTAQINAILVLIPWIIICCILGLAVIALIVQIIKGKLNAWLGFFFFTISIYVALMMYKALQGNITGENLYSSTYVSIAMFSFDLFLVLLSVAGLIGEKADEINKKVEYIKADAILIWILFSKAAYEYANVALEAVQVSALKTIGVFVLFVPLMVLGALLGIKKYKKKE